MGEAFNGNPSYVGDYQNYLTGVFNYPMYYTIRDVWGSGKAMTAIKDRYSAEGSAFKDQDALGLFVDNHDNARFLHDFSNKNRFKNALAFSLTARGIPFFYQGDEQGYAGGADPNNREPLWTNMNTGSEYYTFVKTIVNARKAHKIWGQSQV